MARPLRLEYRHALYHVTSRGDGRELIYLDDKDRADCLEVLAQTVERFNWVVHAYCLMGNHYHLLIETPDANLCLGMRQFNGVYTQRFNRRHRRVGHVFQGRYKAILVQKETHLLELARYVVLNPVRARVVRSVQDWAWSSYRATAGLAPGPEWLQSDWILSAFGSRASRSRVQYRTFVAQGKNQPSPWAQLKNQIYLGDESFVAKTQRLLDPDKNLDEVPRAQRRPTPKPLDYYLRKCRSRDEAIRLAYASGGYNLKGIGEHFGLHYSRVSRIVAEGELAKGKT